MNPFYQTAELLGGCEHKGRFAFRELEIYTIPRLSREALVKVFIS